MSDDTTSTLAAIGERNAIKRLCRRLKMNATVCVGPGDDCAVVRPSESSEYDLVLTSDPVLHNVHFTDNTPMACIGHKVVARSLSDIAAMAAEPLWALIDVQAPSNISMTDLEQLYDGACEVAERHGLAIVGGDMSSANELGIHLFACGRVPCGSATLRSGATPGERLMVTGTLGGSIHGKHLTFEPRVEQGLWLRGRASAMIDISDGIATDALHLARASNVNLHIDAKMVPISRAALDAAHAPAAALHAAFCDGEDFELLFTLSAACADEVEQQWRMAFPMLELTCIGEVRPGNGELLLTDAAGHATAYSESGYAHFKGN